VISEIAEQPLDYSKPLWEVYLVEGLEGGRVASVAKIHHAVADGVASAEMLEQFYDPEPTDPETLPAPPPYQPAPMPSKRSLIRPALADVFKLLRDGLPHILRLRKEAKARVAGRGAEHAPPKAYSGPSFSFSRTISSHRVFTCVSFSLDEIREVKAAFDTTINDVILAMSAGALRRYLQKRGDLPDQPLVAGIPVSMRGDEHKGSYGNVLGSMYVALRTDVADPVERLRATHEAAKISKTEFRATWGARLENWIEFWPPILCKVFGRFSTLMAKKGKVDRNLIISNVTGPRQYLYAGKTRVESFFSVGPVLEGSGVVNITAWSYADQLNFALLACREAIPDLWEMTDGLRDALEELKKAAAAVSVSKPAATDGRRDGRELEVVAPDGGEIYVHQTS
jgi:diacylglycerol O-acyltransferase / wax synthase